MGRLITIIRGAGIALFCQGHCLLEGVPGLAKTLMISSISDLLSLNFSHIQSISHREPI